MSHNLFHVTERVVNVAPHLPLKTGPAEHGQDRRNPGPSRAERERAGISHEAKGAYHVSAGSGHKFLEVGHRDVCISAAMLHVSEVVSLRSGKGDAITNTLT